jgi:hypothetical protein
MLVPQAATTSKVVAKWENALDEKKLLQALNREIEPASLADSVPLAITEWPGWACTMLGEGWHVLHARFIVRLLMRLILRR